MTTDISTLEHHHNALQISFNLLLLSLTKSRPEVVEEWLSALRYTLDTEPAIPDKQREILLSQLTVLTQHMKTIKLGG